MLAGFEFGDRDPTLARDRVQQIFPASFFENRRIAKLPDSARCIIGLRCLQGEISALIGFLGLQHGAWWRRVPRSPVVAQSHLRHENAFGSVPNPRVIDAQQVSGQVDSRVTKDSARIRWDNVGPFLERNVSSAGAKQSAPRTTA